MIKQILSSGFLAILLLLFQPSFAQIFPNEDWLQALPASKGLQPAKLQQMNSDLSAGQFGNVRSVIIIKDGYLVHEYYAKNINRDSLHSLQSITKNLATTYVGIALQDGKLKSIEEPVYKAYQFKATAVDTYLIKLNYKHLMTMAAGFKWNEGSLSDPNNSWKKIMESPDNWYIELLLTPILHEPGRRFAYQSGNPILINGAIQELYDQSIDKIATERLFNPLKINRFHFWDGHGGPARNGG